MYIYIYIDGGEAFGEVESPGRGERRVDARR